MHKNVDEKTSHTNSVKNSKE